MLTIVLIPAFEPDEKLLILLRALKAGQRSQLCVVVDDGNSIKERKVSDIVYIG